jgi:hypothetical protein
MTSHRAQSTPRWAGLLLWSLCSLLVAQDNMQNSQTGTGPTMRTPLQINVTGCLKKNAATGRYYVSDQYGRTWELSSKKVDLSKQLFHTVNVSGHAVAANTPEEKGEQGQKPVAGQQPLSLDVLELTMISNSCTR